MTSSSNNYVEGQDRDQLILFPASIEDYIDADNAGIEGNLDVTADMGYYSWVQLKKCLDMGIIPHVPEVERGRGGPKSVPEPPFYKKKFIYDKQSDSYTCPAGNALPFRRWWIDQRQR